MIIGSDLAYRGCKSDAADSVGKDSCSENEDFCVESATNGQPGYTQPTLSCMQCEQDRTSFCDVGVPSTLCAEPTLLGRGVDKCYTIQTSNSLERGCYKSASATCEAAGESCKICDENGCNAEEYSASWCIECNSGDHENCAFGPLDDERSVMCVSSPENDGCYLDTSNDEVKRGCLSSLSEEQQETCKEDLSGCKLCTGEDCNKKPTFQSCIVCDSETTPECATLSGTLKSEVCSSYQDVCFERIEDGRTVRGCLELSICSGENCRECNGNNCNDEPIPKTRKSCYQCEGPDCVLNPDNFSFCRNYEVDDECYVYIESK